MKNIFYISLMSILLCPAGEMVAQSRNIYWMHGFSGDASSMEPHVTYFNPIYQITSYRPVVSTSSGIPAAVKQLISNNAIKPDPANRNIFVAHSMGGLNSLWLHKLKGSSYVGGLVSMGSPYKGAYAANNILNGTMDQLITDGVKKGTKGIRAEPLIAVTWLSISIVTTTINALFGTDKPVSLFDVMNQTANKVLHNTLEDQVDLTPATLNSLRVGGDDMNAIQQYTAFTIPSISLYGVEDYPATLRFISSRLTRDKGKTVDIVNLVDRIYQSCATFSSTHAHLATASLLVLNPISWAAHMYLADCWAVSRDYWNGGLQDATDVLTGCYRTKSVINTLDVWVPDGNCGGEIAYCNTEKGDKEIDPVCLSGHLETITETNKIIINEPGDGLIPVSSPQGMPGCLKTVKMEHTNHEEMKFTSFSQWHLNEIFSGRTTTSRESKYFILNKR